MQGVGGTLMYLALYSVAGLSNQLVFVLCMPLAFVYWMCYAYVSRNSHLIARSALDVAGDDSPNAAPGSSGTRQPAARRGSNHVRLRPHEACSLAI